MSSLSSLDTSSSVYPPAQLLNWVYLSLQEQQQQQQQQGQDAPQLIGHGGHHGPNNQVGTSEWGILVKLRCGEGNMGRGAVTASCYICEKIVVKCCTSSPGTSGEPDKPSTHTPQPGQFPDE
uniref:Uncharacterized protein n=1 Tax=Branchiostoma floridae TaxID=7739 RepID=C3Z590_BRAFL|eukprot:XP_002595991.1 hypothetical protein BRAFLDRAFT_84065 [Branchiostoma floridae]